MKLTCLGHNCWQLDTAEHTVLLDPFLDASPTAPCKAEEVRADCVLVSHGHFDHVGDAVSIVERTGATLLANFELVEWFKKQGVSEEQLLPMNLGGEVELPWGKVQMTLAHHSSSLPDGSCGGSPCGFLLQVEGKRIYFACDTALFLDMKLIGAGGLDLAVLPIGDQFTMGPDASLEAIRLLNPQQVLPCHYNTWPPIEQEVASWAKNVRQHTAAEPTILSPGESLSL